MNQTKSNKQQSKQARAEMRREQAKRKKMIKRVGLFGGLFVLLTLIIIAFAFRPPSPGEKVTIMSDQSHIPDVTSPHKPYNSDPPTSGQHVASTAPWGVHKDPLPKELLVHNLEDGDIVIYYNNQLDSSSIAELESIAEHYKEGVIVNPYPEMKNKITLTGWGRIDRLETVEKDSITKFIQAYRGKNHH
ncbi:DUF3105 domain-containing protein [Paenibacillus spongiae]|uniref:DUF3105 domain-containing protein n=1 Tax=Paenibacillus spongiae TaxID=2909671 RepID=A0ABY5SLI9_9BACL|nr:DUF3105 domain-containing protein [Paenibacillus spongiae]UVI33438.1 DUF3105 domain-containing protein [Paenibacillus spongiae]